MTFSQSTVPSHHDPREKQMRAAQGEGSKEQIAHPQSTLDSSKQKKQSVKKNQLTLTLQLPWVTKTEFLPTISIQ